MAAEGGEVRTERAGPEGRVLVIVFDHPPANALGVGMRRALMQALAEAVEPGLDGVVLAAAGRNFSAATAVDAAGEGDPAADLQAAPSLATLCAAIEDLALPVVAALSGTAAGPGAELALAAHARVAQAEARIVFPDVALGLPPQGGSSQRLPRIVGAAEALDLLLSARAMPAEEALALGLIDQIVEAPPLAAAVALAAALPGPRPGRDRAEGLADVAGWQAAIAAARAEAARGGLPAAARIIDCVDAALYLPFENGVALETVSAEDLLDTPESRGLIAAARAERRAASLPPAVARAVPRGISHLALVGAGPQVPALALLALSRGLKVTWALEDPAVRAQGLLWLEDRLGAEQRAGRMSQAQRDADRARLSGAETAAALVRSGPAAPGLVIHAAAGPDLALLTRALPAVPQLVLGGVEGALGLSLAPTARLAELALPEGGDPEAQAAAVAGAVQLLRRMNLSPLLVGRMPVLGRRLQGAGRAALARLLALGVPRRVLEAALDGFGQPLPDLPEPAAEPAMRAMSEAEVLRRWLGALANEGFRLLEARVARRPSDIDHALIAGWSFPRWRGGPMHQAAGRGLMVLRADLQAWAAEDALWAPAPLLDRMLAEGRRLADLDRL